VAGRSTRSLAVTGMSKHLAYSAFIALACLAFIVSTIVFGALAKVIVAGDTIEHALSEHLHYMTIVGSLVLLSPFLALAGIGVGFRNKRGAKFGFVAFFAGLIPLMGLYWFGYIGSEEALLNRKWTAAALSVGLLPFQSVVVLIVVLVGAAWASRAKATSDS
jgi:hypothetical protein